MNSKATKIVLFTDLDGTLLDEKYSYENVKPVIDQLLILNVAIVFCSSKTRAEIEFYRRKMSINDPFISENGSAIFIPRGYFQFDYSFTRRTHKYDVIELGAAYSTVREKLDKVTERSAAKIIGFGDMTEEEIAKDSGLPLELARLAKRREYDEPFRIVEGNEKKILDSIADENCRYTKGDRYFHMLGNTDKGKAVAILKSLYVKRFRQLITYGIGDSPNDLPMLDMVDLPVFVRETSGEYKHEAAWKDILNQIRATSPEK
ncbi:mannosyl-3-phosphoglycerate phosphatase [Candidatus Bathyarchaeota archaeon]|nr:mannosyl-3-phosphoglycerate phosphatase [Candidatus Bathyarchaeota archaeon]